MSNDQINVVFGADTGALNSGIDEVKEKVGEAGESAPEAESKFEELGKTIAEAFAAEQVAEFVNKMSELGEQIERTATLTGLSTEEVQQFQYAVAMTGGDAESAGQSLLRFESNLAKAQAGAGPAAAAYQALGISLKDADGNAKSAQQVMGEIADKFKDAADGATKVEYATTLGSRGFAQLIPLLDQGKDGLQALNDQFDKTGGKLAPETIEALSGVRHSIVDMWEALKGAGAEMVALAAGPIKVLVKGVEAIGEGFKQDAIWIEEATGKLESFFSKKKEHGASGSWGGASGSWEGEKKEEKPALPPFNPTGKTGGGEDDNADLDYEKEVINTRLQLAKLGLQGQKDVLDEEVAAHKISIDQKFAALKDYTTLEYQTSMSVLDKEAALYDKDTVEYQQALDKKAILTAKYKNDVEKLSAESAKAQDDAAKKSYQSWMSAFKPIESAFDGMLQGILQGTETIGQALSNAFANAAISVVESIAKILAEWLVFEVATEGQGTWASFVALQGGSGGLIGGIGSILGFDEGTPYVQSTGLAMIHQGEMIIPAAQAQTFRETGGLGGSSSVNVTFNVSAIDGQSAASFIKSQASNIAQAISGQIRNANSALKTA